MKNLSLVIIYILLSISVFSQSKGVFVSNYHFKNNAERWCWSITQDVNSNMMFGVTKGVIVTDGIDESFVKAGFTPTLMKTDTLNSKVWIAGYNKIGYLTQQGSNHEYTYTNFTEFSDEEFHTMEIYNDTLVIVSNNIIALINSKNEEIIDTVRSEYGDITNLMKYNGTLYFIIDYFLFELKGNKLIENEDIDFPVDVFPYTLVKDDMLLLGTASNVYYTFNGNTFRTKEFKNSSFFKQNIIFNAQSYSDTLVVMSSIAGGVGVINLNSNKVAYQVDFFNGLPDDEIRTLYIDNNSGIWVSHGFGVSRIDLQTGIEEYTFFPGLKGNPIALSFFNNELYIASTDGLFVLEKQKDYTETQYRVKYQETKQIKSYEKAKEKSTVATSEQEEKSRRLWRRDRKKKDDEDATEKKSVVKMKPTIRTKTVDKYRTVRKRKLKSVSEVYTQIESIGDEKIKQLLPYDDYLLAAGNKGLYAIIDKKAERVIKNAYIHSIFYSKELNQLLCCTDNGLFKVERKKNKWETTHFYETTSENVLSVTNADEGNWVIAIENRVLYAKLADNEIKVNKEVTMPEEPGEIFFVKNIEGKIKVYTSTMVYSFNSDGKLNVIEELPEDSYLLDNQPLYTFINKENVWQLFTNMAVKPTENAVSAIQLMNKIRYINVSDAGDIWLINEANQIVKMQADAMSSASDFHLKIKYVKENEKFLTGFTSIDLPAKGSSLSVGLSAPFYLVQNGVSYSYRIDGFENEWADWSDKPTITIKYMPPGSYELQIKSKNELGQIAVSPNIELSIAKPFTQTIVFYLLLIIVFVGFSYAFSKYRHKKLEKDKKILETKVRERTQTIEIQKNRIEKQHHEITQSIKYAQRIQRAMLPLDEIMEAMLPNHFVLFMPRDIVSGDFYFFKPLGKYIIFVAADCTGHGVPGGFMSMLGISYLSEITSQLSDKATAAEVINHLREKIKLTLGQTSIDAKQKDGMDLTICLINTEEKKIQFAGAFNPLYIIRNNELITVKGDRQPVAVYYNESEFTNHEIDVQEGDKFYMFSDGYPDQIGGPKERKYMTKNFKKLIIDIHDKPMNEQRDILQTTVEEWRGDMSQVDDILVVGFEVFPND